MFSVVEHPQRLLRFFEVKFNGQTASIAIALNRFALTYYEPYSYLVKIEWMCFLLVMSKWQAYAFSSLYILYVAMKSQNSLVPPILVKCKKN